MAEKYFITLSYDDGFTLTIIEDKIDEPWMKEDTWKKPYNDTLFSYLHALCHGTPEAALVNEKGYPDNITVKRKN